MDVIDRIFDIVDEKYEEQRKFAKDIGVSPSKVSEWRHRKSHSYVKRLEIISEALNTTPTFLLTGKDPKGKEDTLSDPVTLDREDAQLLRRYHALSPEARGKLLGYLDALSAV